MAKTLEHLFPDWRGLVEDYGWEGDASDIEAESLAAIAGTDLYAMATMWVDQVGDSSSQVIGASNFSLVSETEFSHAVNMTSTVSIYRKDKPGPAALLVRGQNGEGDPVVCLYTA